MRKLVTLWSVLMVVLLLVLAAGCSKAQVAPTATPTVAPTPTRTVAAPTPTVAAPTPTRAVGAPTPTVAAPTPTPTPAPTPTPTVPKKTYQIKFATQMPVGHLSTQLGDTFINRINELSQGRIKATHYPAGTLLVDKEIPQGLASRSVELAFVNPSMLVGYDPSLDIWTTWFVFKSQQHQEKVEADLLPFANEMLVPKGIRLIGYSYNTPGDQALANNKKLVTVPSDVKGLRVRVGGKIMGLQLEAFGMASVFMSSSEAYTAIERGTIDGALSGIGTIVSRKWFEVGKYVTQLDGSVPGPGGWPWVVAVNDKFWNELDASDQQIFLQAAAELKKLALQRMREDVEGWRQQMQKQLGQTFVWIQVGSPTWNEWYDALSQNWREPYVKEAGARGEAVLKMIDKYK